MVRAALLAAMVLSGSVQAAECTISNARYEHDQAAWYLSFKPVPKFGAPNQTAAFIIEMPNSGVRLEGAVHRPNGFGSPLWSIEGKCSADSVESCNFVEGNPAAYGNYGGKVGWFDDTPGARAPDQFILPQLAMSLWYSMYREAEFMPDANEGDVFTLVGCD